MGPCGLDHTCVWIYSRSLDWLGEIEEAIKQTATAPRNQVFFLGSGVSCVLGFWTGLVGLFVSHQYWAYVIWLYPFILYVLGRGP
jgi:hypothetical protein